MLTALAANTWLARFLNTFVLGRKTFQNSLCFRDLFSLLAAMFEHNHEFYSGRIITMDDFQDDFCWQHHIGQKLVMNDIGTSLTAKASRPLPNFLLKALIIVVAMA